MQTFTARPASEHRYPFGEGSRVHEGDLLWVDITAGRLHRAPLDRLDEPQVWEVGMPLGAIAPATAGGFLLAAGRGLAHLGDDGTVRPLLEREPDANRMNDAGCDPSGRMWAGSMAWDEAEGAGSLHRVDLDGTVTTALSGITVANGPAWSPDGGTLYLDDSGRRTLTAYNVDAGSGELTGARVLVHFASEHNPDGGAGDGLTVDDDGFLWVALFGGSAVHRYDPAGRLVARVELPTPQVSSCCLADGRLYVTTAAQQDEPDADAGRLFVADVGVGAPPVRPYRGPLRLTA